MFHYCKVCGVKIATLGRILVTITEYHNGDHLFTRPTTVTSVVCGQPCLQGLYLKEISDAAPSNDANVQHQG